MKKITSMMVAGIALAIVSVSAFAQSWPMRPIRLIVPFAPGGGVDLTGRVLAPKLSEALGQTVIVENRGGAGGLIGVDLGAKASPDGYTVVIGTIGNIAIAPHLQSKMPYDPQKDLVPISQLANALNVMVINPSVKATTVKEFIELAKKEGSNISYGSSGSGATDHLAGEVFNTLAGLKMTHIPYKGGAPAMIDLVGGQVQVIFATVSTAISSIQGGKVRALGMTGNQRYESLPEVPTIAEAGLTGYEADTWYGVFAPAKTPQPILDQLNKDIVAVLNLPDIRKKFASEGAEIVADSSASFTQKLRADVAKWKKVIADLNLRAE